MAYTPLKKKKRFSLGLIVYIPYGGYSCMKLLDAVCLQVRPARDLPPTVPSSKEWEIIIGRWVFGKHQSYMFLSYRCIHMQPTKRHEMWEPRPVVDRGLMTSENLVMDVFHTHTKTPDHHSWSCQRIVAEIILFHLPSTRHDETNVYYWWMMTLVEIVNSPKL